jgi:methionine synthase II (cobalamin-independent)
MPIPTGPVGSLPRSTNLQAAYADYDAGKIEREQLIKEQDVACLDPIKRMEATGSPCLTASSECRALRPIP